MANNDRTPDSENVRKAYQELGHLGGEATAETHGHEFYSEIGHKGGPKGGEARKEQMARGEIFTKENPSDPSQPPAGER